MTVVELLDGLAIVPRHIATVRLDAPYRAVMYLGSRGWQVSVVLVNGHRVALKTWRADGNGPGSSAGDAEDEPAARSLYEAVLDAIRNEP